MAPLVIAAKLSADSTIFPEIIFRSFSQVRMGNESRKLGIQVPPIISTGIRHQPKQCGILIAFEGGENGLSVVNVSRQPSCMFRPCNQDGNVNIRFKFTPYVVGSSDSETKESFFHIDRCGGVPPQLVIASESTARSFRRLGVIFIESHVICKYHREGFSDPSHGNFKSHIINEPVTFEQNRGYVADNYRRYLHDGKSFTGRFWSIFAVILSGVSRADARPTTSQTSQFQSCAFVTINTKFPTKVKAAATILALISAVLITATYYILIGASTRLATSSRLPFPSISKNIGTLLGHTWPDTSNTAVCETTATPAAKSDAIRLMYVGKMNNRKGRTARGIWQCEALPDATIATPPFWLTSGSSLTTSLAQLVVWEWVFLWINAFMIIATLLYNGILTNTPGPDSYLRLTVVFIYAVAYLFHATFMWHAFSSFLTLVAMGSAWSLLHRASFAVVDLAELEHRLNFPDVRFPVDFKKIDKSSGEFTPGSYFTVLEHEAQEPETPSLHIAKTTEGQPAGPYTPTLEQAPYLENERELQDALGTMKKVQETERENCKEVMDAALERVVANGMIMVAIILASCFSVWSTTANDSSNIQAGSLALLASFSLGGVAMFTSAVKMTMANSSYKEILHLKEVKINGQAVEYTKKRISVHRGIGFTYDTVKARKVQFRDLIKITSFVDMLLFLLFGPAYSLLPSEADQSRVSTGTQFTLATSVRSATVVLTTGGTDNHSKDERGVNVEAINVCYRPSAVSTGVRANVSRT